MQHFSPVTNATTKFKAPAPMRIALCQLNSTMGDIAGNLQKIRHACISHAQDSLDLVIFPELFIQGYPPRDLLDQEWFITRSQRALHELCAFSQTIPQTTILCGTIAPNAGHNCHGLYNSAIAVRNGSVVFTQHKSLLPTYDVFDEGRYFDKAADVSLLTLGNERIGVSICEDAWNDVDIDKRKLYDDDPISRTVQLGATMLINISGSPFHSGKQLQRFSIMQNHSIKHKLPLVFVNLVGGNDDLIFDGSSAFFDATGAPRTVLPAFTECVSVIDTLNVPPVCAIPEFDAVKSIHDALCLGLYDYVKKCGFSKVLIGLSGGIDSAVTAALATAALGKENIWGVTMPSRYSSSGSISDSEQLAKNLGIQFSTIPIDETFAVTLKSLAPHFKGLPSGLAEENLQARTRGVILMALSNKHGHLVLSTGNKSEMAVGYCTLYGDMNGGLSVISDLPKTMVYQLAHYINRNGCVIPQATIDKAPSAELKPDQKDQDTLPPYDVLDNVLQLLIEERKSSDDIIALGFDAATVKWIVKTIKNCEYKRRQAATGLKVTPKAFGIGRRFPIAARYEW